MIGVLPQDSADTAAAWTAAHRVDRVFPPLPVRQWVLSVPKRLRDFLQRAPAAANALLHIFLSVVEATLRAHSPGAGPRVQLGAVSFLHRFGSARNRHRHIHCCVLDGVFEAAPDDGQVTFREAVGLSAQEVAAVQAPVRHQVRHGFVRRGWLTDQERRKMQGRPHGGGFSLDAEVRSDGADRVGPACLLRYCARPPVRPGALGGARR